MIKVTNQIGKELRLSRFLNPDSKRTVMVAYAHGILMGPMKGMETNEAVSYTHLFSSTIVSMSLLMLSASE